jgi:hypothetical protein
VTAVDVANRIGAGLATLLLGCGPHVSLVIPPPPPSAPALPAAPPPVASTPPPPEEDVDGVPHAVDLEPPPPPFDPAAWLAQRGVTTPIPEEHSCKEPLPSAPNRPDMLLCRLAEQVHVGPDIGTAFWYVVGHTVVFAVSGKNLRKVFDVIDGVLFMDAVTRDTGARLLFDVRVEEDGAAVVVEERPKANCARALAKRENYDPSGAKRNAADLRFLEKACRNVGRHVFSGGRFHPPRLP